MTALTYQRAYIEKRRRKAQKVLAILTDYFSSENVDTKALSLLDVGCSMGAMTETYARYFGRVVGIDIDDKALECANGHTAVANVEFFCQDALETGFDDGSFDVITCNHVYEHVAAPNALMR